MSKTDDLVALSGVSRSTVFRFLRGENVRPKARMAILEAMRQLNIQHEDHAVHRGTTLLISIRPGFKTFKGYDLSISGFMDRAESYGFHVLLQTGSALPFMDSNRSPKVAGVLFLGKTIVEEDQESARLRDRGVPHVFVNRMFDDHAMSWVSVDHRQAAQDAVEHLIGLGHRNIGTWGVTDSYRIDRDKRVGFLRAFEEAGIEPPKIRLDSHRDGDLEEAVQRVIDRRKLPTAWFAASDEHAMRFIKVARDNGIAVPEDVVLVGMDDVEPAEYFSPPLSSVHIPFHDAGAAAVDVLKRLIENPHEQSVRVVLKHRLVVRESCGTKRTAGAAG